MAGTVKIDTLTTPILLQSLPAIVQGVLGLILREGRLEVLNIEAEGAHVDPGSLEGIGDVRGSTPSPTPTTGVPKEIGSLGEALIPLRLTALLVSQAGKGICCCI